MSLRSPLARARGLGAAHNGTHHWWVQRLTSIALAPLMLWLAFSFVSLATADHAAATAWLRSPINAILMLALIATLFHHMQLGLQVVIEDYVHSHTGKFMTLIAVKYGTALLAIASTAMLWWQRARSRTHLRDLEAHLLDDIGMSPEQRDREVHKPFWVR